MAGGIDGDGGKEAVAHRNFQLFLNISFRIVDPKKFFKLRN